MVNEHYVPKFYLRLFAPENRSLISRYSLVEKHGGGDYYPLRDEYPIEKAASAENYANGLLEDDETNRAERVIRNALMGIVEDRSLSEEDIAHLSQFLAFQRDRSPLAKFHHETTEELAELSDDFEAPSWETVLSHDADRGHESLQYMGWFILENQTEVPFITSDLPVVWYLSEQPDDDEERHMLEGMQIYCPIGPNHLLAVLDPGTFDVDPQLPSTEIDRVSTDSKIEVQKFNALQIIYAFREVFGPVGAGELLEKTVDATCKAFPDKEFVRGSHEDLEDIQKARRIAIRGPKSEAEKNWYHHTGKQIILDEFKASRANWEFNLDSSFVDDLRRDNPNRDYW